MTSVEIRALLAPPDTASASQKALALLDAQFASLVEHGPNYDLTALESAVREAEVRQKHLADELAHSQRATSKLIADTRASIEAHLHSAQEIALLRHALADELASLEQELLSIGGRGAEDHGERAPTLLEDIESMHRSLKELESVREYVRVIERALSLSEASVDQLRQASKPVDDSHLSTYSTLLKFVNDVARACANVEDGAGSQTLHIVQFLDRIRAKTWNDMKNVLNTPLLAAAEQLKWPMPIDYAAASPVDRQGFESAFSNLLRLQTLGEKLHNAQLSAPSSTDPAADEKEGLYPLQALVHAVALRFKYHFEGTRQTNRLDKPEWYFTHILNVAHEHRAFMETVIQPILASSANASYRKVVAQREFTALLLPLVSRKLRRTVPSLLDHPALLAHTIYQALSFDEALVADGFSPEGTTRCKIDGQEKWVGISDVILGRKEWFDAWMEGERKFADDQYNEIISSGDAWLIADDDGVDGSADPDELRSTNSARRVKALVEQVTDRYAPLPHFTQRTRFLINVQLPILEAYHSRISASLDAFETLSSAFVRAVPGALGFGSTGVSGARTTGATMTTDGARVDTRRLTTGVEGGQRLIKALVSARYIATAMEAWGEDMFFLELWAEINQKASLRSRAEVHPSLPDPRPAATSTTDIPPPEGTIFEELVIQYSKLADRAEEMIIHQICGEIETGLRAHYAAGNTISSPSEDDIAISQTLLEPIALLSSHLKFLRSTLPSSTATHIYRRIGSRLAEHIVNRAVMYRGRGHLSMSEGKTTLAETELWIETSQAAIGGTRKRVEAPWRSLLETARLVALDGDSWERVEDATFGFTGDAEWRQLLADVGVHDMGRERVGAILKIREDCEH